MKLIKFTAASNNNPPVYINPDHVTAVKATSKHTLIYASGGSEHSPVFFPVREEMEEVVSRLTS